MTPTARDLGVTGGSVTRALLVPDQDVPHLGGIEQRIVDREDRTAGDTEDHVDAELLKRTDHRLCSADPLGGHDVLGDGTEVAAAGDGCRPRAAPAAISETGASPAPHCVLLVRSLRPHLI